MGAARRRRDDYDLALFTAWHIEAFARQKTLPDLKSLLNRNRDVSDKPMTAMQVRATMMGLQAKPLTEAEKKMLAKRKARAKGKR